MDIYPVRVHPELLKNNQRTNTGINGFFNLFDFNNCTALNSQFVFFLAIYHMKLTK